MFPWGSLCEHGSRISLWEMPFGIHWSRDNWSGSVLCEVPQTGTPTKTHQTAYKTLILCDSPVLVDGIWVVLFFPDLWGYRWVFGSACEWRLHRQLTLLQHYGKTTHWIWWLSKNALTCFWVCVVFIRAPSVVEIVKLALQATRWKAARTFGFAPMGSPTPVTSMQSVSWRETAALAVW